MIWISLEIVSWILGCCTFTATTLLFRVALCTWPILADAIGFISKLSKIESIGFENSSSIIVLISS